MSILLESTAVTKDRSRRQPWPLERKVSLVLEGLRGQQPVTELCRQRGISTSCYYQWRDRFLQAGRDGLAEIETEQHELEERIQKLEAENAALRLEKEILQSACLED